jgi:hypothetical protein
VNILRYCLEEVTEEAKFLCQEAGLSPGITTEEMLKTSLTPYRYSNLLSEVLITFRQNENMFRFVCKGRFKAVRHPPLVLSPGTSNMDNGK